MSKLTKMYYMIKKSVKKFNSVYLNKLLECQGEGFKDLPIMNEHMDNEKKKSILCY